MIYRLSLIAFLSAVSLFLISAKFSSESTELKAYDPVPPFSGGVGAVSNQDRTGSPISSGTCANCHSGGSFGVNVTLDVFDPVSGSSVTSYVPGSSYEVTFTVNGTAPGYGFQSTVLNSSSTAGGSLSNPSGGQIVTIGGNSYLEHQGGSVSGVFQATWTAPAAGSGTITFYATGLGVNGNGGTSGDQSTSPFSQSLTEEVPTTIDYPGNPFCANAPSQSPAVTGETTGTFSAPAGLSINSGTGIIDFTSSTPGTYSVGYAYSSGTTTFDVTILPTFSSSTTVSICANETISFGTQTLDASNAGLNTEVFQAANGCDSIVELTLTVLPTFEENTTATICEGETFDFNGTILTEANVGLNTAVIQAVNGCDSTVNLTLSVETVDNTVTVSGTTLTANQIGATYQWVDCENGNVAIAGETSASFTPTTTGNYAVEITLNNCTETSVCTLVDFTSLEELSEMEGVVFPNPVKDVFEITNFDQMGTITSMALLDGSGRVVHELSSDQSITDIAHLDAGVYFLKIRTAAGQSIVSLVKE